MAWACRALAKQKYLRHLCIRESCVLVMSPECPLSVFASLTWAMVNGPTLGSGPQALIRMVASMSESFPEGSVFLFRNPKAPKGAAGVGREEWLKGMVTQLEQGSPVCPIYMLSYKNGPFYTCCKRASPVLTESTCRQPTSTSQVGLVVWFVPMFTGIHRSANCLSPPVERLE